MNTLFLQPDISQTADRSRHLDGMCKPMLSWSATKRVSGEDARRYLGPHVQHLAVRRINTRAALLGLLCFQPGAAGARAVQCPLLGFLAIFAAGTAHGGITGPVKAVRAVIAGGAHQNSRNAPEWCYYSSQMRHRVADGVFE